MNQTRQSNGPSCERDRHKRWLCIAALSLTAACGASEDGGSGAGAGNPTNNGASQVDVSAADGISFNGGSSGGSSDGAGLGDGAEDSGCEFDGSPLPGQAGAVCAGNADCDSGVCVEGPAGKICTRKCTECCPNGFRCEQWAQDDSQYICVPKMSALCRPCTLDAQCAKLSDGALCVPSGDKFKDPWFCGGECNVQSDCPTGHACEQVEGQNGAGKQCVRKEGQCACSKRSINEGATTSCQASNDAGSCPGLRKCQVDGSLGPCSASSPAPESCDGVDNDCNGKTDDDIAPVSCEVKGSDGSCKGKQSCIGGQPTCEAPTPGPETCDGFDNDCDGQTDEGFPDIDGDKIADCIDGDKDGDGVPNEKDCAPGDPAVAPNKSETCDGKDNDCDGTTDEQGAIGCVDYWQDLDKDGYGDANEKRCLCQPNSTYNSKQPGDCDDGNKLAFPSNPEACDGADNDCDGKTDELWGLGKVCDSGSGACKQFGKVVCTDDGKGATCSVKAGSGEEEVCDGQDNDCDGKTDESLTRACGTGCGKGIETCSNGKWGGCDAPKPECDAGPCCDGCKLRGASYKCGVKSAKTTYTCSKVCAGSAKRYEHWQYCDGKQPTCAGALKPVYKGVAKTCASNQACQTTGSSYSCKNCSGGCTGSTCSAQPIHTICVDAGYGGTEGGTTHHGVSLKEINLELAKELKTWLDKDTNNTTGGGRWKVVMTRTTDKTISINQRAAICNGANAGRHLSLFINAIPSGAAYGVSTYYYKSSSKTFCESVHSESVSHGATKSHTFKSTSQYGILKAVKANGCLTLPGWLSTASEATKIKTKSWRQAVTLGYLNAIQKSYGYAPFTP